MTNLEFSICEAENNGDIDLDTRNKMLKLIKESTSKSIVESEDINIIFESKGQSKLSDNFKPKTIDKKFKYIDINSRSAVKYLKQDSYCKRLLDYIHKYVNGEIIIDEDKDKIVGYVFIGNEKKDPGWITSLDVKKEYRGYGLGKTLMKDAVHKYGGVDLCVYKDNEIAIKIYKDLGFKIVGDYKPDKSMYYMKLPGVVIKESSSDKYLLLKEMIYESELNGEITVEERVKLLERLEDKYQ